MPFLPPVLAPVAVLVAPGSRPAECLAAAGGGSSWSESGAANVWERVKSPSLSRYCEVLARAETRLAASSPAARDALAMAGEAEELRPGSVAPLVLRGRALVRLGRADEALKVLDEVRSRDPRALDSPASLLAWGRALAAVGRTEDAAGAYDALLPRASLLPEGERASAPLEASLLAMTRGPSGLPEALSAAREGRRSVPASGATPAIVVMALALDRSGRAAEARALLAPYPAHDLEAALDEAALRDALALTRSPDEAFALGAVVAGAIDPSKAPAAWLRYLTHAPETSPWRAHAEGRAGVPDPKASKAKAAVPPARGQ